MTGRQGKPIGDQHKYLTVLSKFAISAAFHPIEYSKILIQIGHEPLPPMPVKTFFGRPALALPNVFKYASHIRKRDGFFGMYRGLKLKLLASATSTITYSKVVNLFPYDPLTDKDEEDLTEEERRTLFVNETIKEMASRVTAVIISHPFHVMTVRCMAQFVGGEEKYSGIFNSIRSVYDESGILGYFAGIIPRVLGEVATLALCNSLIFLVNNYIIEDKTLTAYASASMSFLSSAVTYPFHVVTSCMIVSNSGLAAGCPPYMPLYYSWTDCWVQLQRQGSLKRGSSILWRYYKTPALSHSDMKHQLDKL